MRQADSAPDSPGLRAEGIDAEGSAQSSKSEEELCARDRSCIREGRTVKQTILANSIKWALARPNARWELVAFDTWLATEHAAWRLKTLATTGQTAAE